MKNTSPTIIPVEAIKDIIKTICDFSGSNKYAHGRLMPPANSVALTPIMPYKYSEYIVIFAPINASSIQGTRAAIIPKTASSI